MQIIKTVAELRSTLVAGNSLLVPTMGNLHAGHLSLIEQARRTRAANNADASVVASIFVNRLQFAPNEDFDQYPRTFERDCDLLDQAGCDVLFAPDESQLYPEPQTYQVQPDSQLAGPLEGASRPGFFDGVCTVVLKLFNCVQPSHAAFGKKDYQQLQVIKRMVSQLAMPIEILAGETVREDTGLAMSSRNNYLSPREKLEAAALYRCLCKARDQLQAGMPLAPVLGAARDELAKANWRVDYFELRRRDELSLLDDFDGNRQQCVLLTAANLGEVRLIDNLEF